MLCGCALAPAERAALRPDALLKVRWRAAIDEPDLWTYRPTQFAQPAYEPKLDALFVATSGGRLARVGAGSGRVRWITRPSGAPLHADPALDRRHVFSASLRGEVFAHTLFEGSERWRYQADDAVEGVLTPSEGRLFFTDARETLYALDAVTGELLWRYKRRAPDFFTIKGSGTPVASGDAIYAGFADGTLAALQPESGELLWAADLSGGGTEFLDVDAAAIVRPRAIYAASYAGGVFAISPTDGSILWRLAIPSVTDLIWDDGALLIASATGSIMAVDAASRDALWRARIPNGAPLALRAQGARLLVTTASGPMLVLDRYSGRLMTSWDPSAGFNAAPALAGRRAYLFSDGGYLYGVDIATQ